MAAAILLPMSFFEKSLQGPGLRRFICVTMLSVNEPDIDLTWVQLAKGGWLNERSSRYLRDIKMLLSSWTKFETIYSKIKKAQNDAMKTFSWGSATVPAKLVDALQIPWFFTWSVSYLHT